MSPARKVTGVDTDDPMLSLEGNALAVRSAIVIVARHLWTATIMANQAPLGARMYERMGHPKIGDLVYETTTGWTSSGISKVETFGLLVEFDAPKSIWHVQYGQKAGDVCRWTNADFRQIPRTKNEYEEL